MSSKNRNKQDLVLKKLSFLQQAGYINQSSKNIAEIHLENLARIAKDIDQEDKEYIIQKEQKLNEEGDEKSLQINYFKKLILDVQLEGVQLRLLKDSFI